MTFEDAARQAYQQAQKGATVEINGAEGMLAFSKRADTKLIVYSDDKTMLDEYHVRNEERAIALAKQKAQKLLDRARKDALRKTKLISALSVLLDGETKTVPKHYNDTKYNAMHFCRHMTFALGNVFKYCWRAGTKQGEQIDDDIRKAVWYAEHSTYGMLDANKDILLHDLRECEMDSKRTALLASIIELAASDADSFDSKRQELIKQIQEFSNYSASLSH